MSDNARKARSARAYLESIREQAADMLTWPDERLAALEIELRTIDDRFPSGAPID